MSNEIANNAVNKTAPNISVFGLGGGSVKTLRRFNCGVTHIDTSNSEKDIMHADSNLILVNTGNRGGGSGGNSANTIEVISDQIPLMVGRDFEINEINVVVYSASGGSGRAIAHVLIEQMLQAGASVVVFTTYTINDLNRASNVAKSLAGLSHLANHYKQNIPVHAFDTSVGFAETDARVLRDLGLFLGTFGDSVQSLDYMDRKSALNPSCMPGYAEFGLLAGECFLNDEIPKAGTPISVVTLALMGKNDDIGTGAAFIFSGILPNDFEAEEDDNPTISVLYSAGVIPHIQTAANAKVAEFKRKTISVTASVRNEVIAVDDAIQATSNGSGFFV